MIKQVIDVDGYWEVVVFYDLDYDFLDIVEFELRKLNFSKAALERLMNTLLIGKAKAVTCNSEENHVSVVIFNPHSSHADYINSIVHEAEHVKQAMLNAYDVEDKGELPAYTIGFIVMKMYEAFKKFLFT